MSGPTAGLFELGSWLGAIGHPWGISWVGIACPEQQAGKEGQREGLSSILPDSVLQPRGFETETPRTLVWLLVRNHGAPLSPDGFSQMT